MGIVLGFSLFIGVFIGVLVSVALVAVAIILTRKASTQRLYVWRIFALVALVSLPVLIFVVYRYPYDTGTPGSNYAILFKYYFFIGLAYTVTPGAAAILAFLATLFCRKDPMADVQAAGPVFHRRPIHFLLPAFCLLLGFWIGTNFIIFRDVNPRKPASVPEYTKANRLVKTADALFKHGKHKESARLFSEVIESGKFKAGKLSDIYVRRGWAHIRLGNHDAAAADFGRAIQLAPENAAAFNGRGWSRVERDKCNAALADFASAIKISSRYAMVFNNRGVALKDMGQRGPARENYRQAIDLANDPEAKAYALFNLAWLDYQDGHLESALAYSDRGIETLPDYAMGHSERGAIREDLGQHEEALADYARAIELNNDPEAAACARLNRGARHLMDNDPPSAERDFAAILRDQLPKKEEAAVWLFISLKESGMSREEIERRMAELIKEEALIEWPASALDLFNERITMNEFTASYWHPNQVKRLPRRAEMFFFAGQYWLYLGQMEKTMDCFERCVQLGVRDSNAARMARAILSREKSKTNEKARQ